MGMNISDIKNIAIKNLAIQIDEQNNKNGQIDGNEVSLFDIGLSSLLELGHINESEAKEIWGLEKSNEAQPSSQGVTTPVELSKKDTKTNQTSVKQTVEKLVKSGVHPNDLIARLKIEYENPEYVSMINDVETILNLVNATNYQSKNDVNKIHKTVKKQLKDKEMWKDFHQDVLKSLEEQAEKTQIAKEYETLKDRYIGIKNTMANTNIVKEKGDNFKAYVEILKNELKNDKTWKKSYTKEAFEYVEKYAQEDAMIVAQSRLDDKTKGDDNKDIKKEMEKLNTSGDKYQDKAIKELKMDRKTFGRKHTYEKNLEELKNISREKLQKELDKDTFEKLNRSYLGTVKNPDGTYNLTQLAEAILSRAGVDYTVSRNDDDPEMGELTHVGRHLRSITGQEFSKSELKDLIKLSGIKYERRDRSFKAITREAFDLPSASAAATSGAILAPYVKVTQDAILRFADETTIQEVIKQLTEQGIKFDKVATKDGVALKILQNTTVNLKPLGPLASIIIEAAVKGLWTLAFGADKNEKSCMSVSDYDINDPTYTNPEKYKEYVAKNYHNAQKINAIHALVDTYVQAYGEDWHTHYQQGLRGMAGIGSKLNPAECSMMKYQKVDVPAPKQPDKTPNIPDNGPVENPPEQDPVDEKPCLVVTRENIKLDGTNGNPNSAKYYWDELIRMYYPNCLKENGGSHTMKEIRFRLRKVNNIPNNYPSVPKGIVLPYDLFGDGSCERTEKQNTTLRKRVKSNGRIKVLKMRDGSWNYGTQCPNADGNYGPTYWNSTSYKSKAEAERAGREAIGE